MIRKNTNVMYALKVFHRYSILEIIEIFTQERNRISANFARLVLPVKEIMLCMKKDILVLNGINQRNDYCLLNLSLAG